MKAFSGIYLGFIFAILSIEQAIAQPPSVHSDLPIWTNTEDLSPRSFNSDEGFGCFGEIKFGDWKLSYAPEIGEGHSYTQDPEWLKVYNYGVFHCAYGFQWAYEFDDLNEATPTFGHLVDLDTVKTPRGKRHLWAMQIGFNPGSDYIFLTRGLETHTHSSFELLPTDCPKQSLRTAGTIDIFLTDYCSINDKKAMKRFAKRMAKRTPVGTLEYLGSTPK